MNELEALRALESELRKLVDEGGACVTHHCPECDEEDEDCKGIQCEGIAADELADELAAVIRARDLDALAPRVQVTP